MGLMMISVGICAAFWEDKLRSTPGIIRRGYYVDREQYIFGELTHPRPGAAAAAAVRKKQFSKTFLSRRIRFSCSISVDIRLTGRNFISHRSLYTTYVRIRRFSWSEILH